MNSVSFARQDGIERRPHPDDDLIEAPSLSFSVEGISPPMLLRSAHHHNRPRQIHAHNKTNNMTESRQQINSLDDYADLLLRKCDSLLRSYDREKAQSPSKERKRRDNRRASHHSSETNQSTSTSSSSSSSSLNSFSDSSSVLDSSYASLSHRVESEAVVSCLQSNRMNSSEDASLRKKASEVLHSEDRELNGTKISAGSKETSSSSDSSAFLYLSPASSISLEEEKQHLMLSNTVRGEAAAPFTSLKMTEVTKQNKPTQAACPSSSSFSSSALSEDEIAPYIHDSMVSTLWKRLLEVRGAIGEQQRI